MTISGALIAEVNFLTHLGIEDSLGGGFFVRFFFKKKRNAIFEAEEQPQEVTSLQIQSSFPVAASLLQQSLR